jgi:hypothetical protein
MSKIKIKEVFLLKLNNLSPNGAGEIINDEIFNANIISEIASMESMSLFINFLKILTDRKKPIANIKSFTPSIC